MSKSIQTLRNDLCVLFDNIKTKEIDVDQAAEMNNTAGKIIGTLRAELQYAAQRGEEPNIPFMVQKKNKLNK